MKLKNQPVNNNDFSSYSETMRGLASVDKQDPFDSEINAALDELGTIYDILGGKMDKTKKSKSNIDSDSNAISKASTLK